MAARALALAEQAALGVLSGVVAVDLAFDLPAVRGDVDALARAIAYYRVRRSPRAPRQRQRRR